MSNDPWSDEPEEQPALASPITTTNQSPAEPGADNHGMTTSFKGGPGYDAPMIAFRANDPEDMLVQLGGDPEGLVRRDVVLALFKLTAKLAAHFSILSGSKPASESAKPSDAPKTQPTRTGHPQGRTESCKHGDMPYAEWVSNAGKACKAFRCTERNRDQQCDIIWVK